jgi:hypothetical protein
MEKFWAAILIFVVVAAAGLMYVNQVYNPQKDSQAAMAETANQTLSAVKTEMENDTTPSVVTASSVMQTVKQFCISGNTIAITVKTSSGTEVYTTDHSDIYDQMEGITKYFLKKPERSEEGVLEAIAFDIIN